MARKKTVRAEDDFYLDDALASDGDEAELLRSMNERGLVAMTGGCYRSVQRCLADEVVEEF